MSVAGNDFACLFEPVRIGLLELPNRIVMAPMSRHFAENGVLAPTAVDYYRRRAEGGVGLILTEGIAISRIGAQNARVPHMLTPEARSIWQDVVRAVQAGGGRIMAQLWHAGLGRVRAAGFDPELLSIGPCDRYLPDDSPLVATGGNHAHGRAMTAADIAATVHEFAEAAVTAQALGFDGIQLQGAHGFLFDQFFWPETNRRLDGYGGDIVGRTRFACDVIAAIRGATGRDFVIGFRFSQWKLPAHYDIKPLATPADLEALLMPLAQAGVDFFDASARRYWEPAFAESSRNLAGWARKLTGLPSMTVGSVGLDRPLGTRMIDGDAESIANLAPLADMIRKGDVDLVGVGRALIANPDWAARIRRGAESMNAFAPAMLAAHY